MSCVPNRAWMFSHAGGYNGIQVDKITQNQHFLFLQEEGDGFRIEKPVIIWLLNCHQVQVRFYQVWQKPYMEKQDMGIPDTGNIVK